MKISGDSKLILGVFIASILILILGAMLVLRPTPTYESSELILDTTVTRGSKDAVVNLVEFSDFQCPACKAFVPIVEQILTEHGDKVLFAYRHFPLPQHEFAFDAAQAFEAANEQGKGWEMYNYLFANQASITATFINDSAKELGLDIDAFDTALATEKHKQKIDQDVAAAIRLGVNSTPTFFLNGQKLKLNTGEDLPKAVDEAILNAR